MRRKLLLGVALLAGFAAAIGTVAVGDPPPISATSQGGNQFTPSTVTINAGETVTLKYAHAKYRGKVRILPLTHVGRGHSARG